MKKIASKVPLFGEWFFFPIILLILLSIVSWLVAYSHNLTLSYNDSMSHLNISRLVFDNQEPGLSQIGSVWLPLNHLLQLIFVWNDFAWRTGLAGSIFSMSSYVISVLAIYKIVFILTKNRIGAVVGGLAFALNLNILYLQSTSLTEPLYIALFLISMLLFTLWITKRNNAKYLMLIGVIGFFQVIARYDGWFVVFIEALLISYTEIAVYRVSLRECLGKVLLFGLPIIFGISLWFLWNGLIFGNPLFFLIGPYSAHAQQATIAESGKLLTKGNIIYSFADYGFAILDNIGTYDLFLALSGFIAFLLIQKRNFSLNKKLLIIAFLLSPIIFNILALFLGFSILNVPQLNWNPSGTIQGQWFNVRYGVLALPFVAVLIGFFASWRKLAVVIAIGIIITQASFMYSAGIITITDGTIGSSAFRAKNVARELQNIVKPNQTILMSMSVFNPVAFKSNLELKQIIHEGVSKKWASALRGPEAYADIILMGGNGNSGDPVRRALTITYHNTFLQNYEKVYEDNEGVIYKLKKNKDVAIRSEGK